MTTEAEIPVRTKLRGDNWLAYKAQDRELLIEGPARTGKTFALLTRMVRHAQEVKGYRGLICRKVAATLGSSVLRTLEEDVFYQWDTAQRRSALDQVLFFGGSQNEPPWYEFDNGSRIVVGGLDNPSKILGSEYDEIFANQVEELSIEDLEILLTRLSRAFLPHPCLLTDCNPTYDKHWVRQRALSGQMRHLRSTLKDNPAFYDDEGEPTERGRAYLESIAGLTGTRRDRFVLGLWVGVENAIYDVFDRYRHMVPIRQDSVYVDGALGVDYGDVHPHAVCAVSRTSGGRLVVRACWSGRGYEALVETAGRFKVDLKINRVRVDPMLKGWEHPAESPLKGRVNRADASPGSRKNRIELVYRLLQDNALTLDSTGEGNAELADEIEMYHYVHRQTDQVDDLVVARINDDRVAALEYAIEELEGRNYVQLPVRSVGRARPSPALAIGGRRLN